MGRIYRVGFMSAFGSMEYEIATFSNEDDAKKLIEMFKDTVQEYDVDYEVIEFDSRPVEDWTVEYNNGNKRVVNYIS